MPPSHSLLFIGFYKHFGEELYIENPDEHPNAFVECNAEDPACSESVPLQQLRVKSHSDPYYGSLTEDFDKEFENYDFSADPYFNYDPNYNYEANGVDGAKGVNGTKGVNGDGYR